MLNTLSPFWCVFPSLEASDTYTSELQKLCVFRFAFGFDYPDGEAWWCGRTLYVKIWKFAKHTSNRLPFGKHHHLKSNVLTQDNLPCMFCTMFEASISEFPFVATLPKREKSAVGKALDVVAEFTALTKEHGSLVPAGLVGPMLNLSKQRVQQLIDGGRFPGAVKFHRNWFIPEVALIDYAKAEKLRGRPPKALTFKESLEVARGMLATHKRNS